MPTISFELKNVYFLNKKNRFLHKCVEFNENWILN